MKTAVYRCPTGGVQVEQADICSTCVPPAGQQNEARWNARKPLPCLKNWGLFHLGHQKTIYPRICAPQPRCAPVWAFPGRGGNLPRPDNGGDVGPCCGNGKRPVPVILNAVKNPLSLLRVSRDGTGDTDPSTSLCSAHDDSDEQSARKRSTRCAPLLAEQSVSQCLCNLPFGRRNRTHWTWDAEAG